MTNPITNYSDTSINQADYLKLFMQQLTYQDPLKPIDNREFMVQMAQFSALQEAQATTSTLQILAVLTSANQALMLLGKTVTIKGTETQGTVNKIEFSSDGTPLIYIDTQRGNPPVRLRDIAFISNRSYDDF
ncbi:flagellar hook assembly protein FlgD [Legionella fairfieldensis]|uniref:flagellar hook assembly protein FlgD n=1 Tax=Legionella fairfieldensis TaxID=45064 RepID=UPI00068825A0|nr:flagellar hook capping FlgD N-terminal domain-containing protein [Legionella fairfieldensis]